ncbi:hypothetical protein KORDIASMS9_01818 [Kordia sp. SMS9]|uniref:hypothetical protein n=1 Tax=Kordia sp. SMS9 TaxID=2282170 RepID=UPI000E0DB7DE|nr:hypothetical protein [Kordia sp. SMS9]AXG69593.1 hypothetical protein KORDIASMS9_01818 [Kordia sp. SMS9]
MAQTYIHEKLLDISLLKNKEQQLSQLLFELPDNGRSPDKFIFNISSISGWIQYSNKVELFKNTNYRRLLKTEGEVEKKAKEFLNDANKEFYRFRSEQPNKNDIPKALFPNVSSLRTGTITIVINSETLEPDHWLCKFQVYLEGSIPVIGAGIDVRIGNDGRVIALTSHWRPLKRNSTVEIIPLEKEQINNEHNHTHGHSSNTNAEEVKPILCYKLEGESTYQTHLCPYWMIPDGHHFTYYPASKESLIIDIFQKHHSNGVELFAGILGGSGGDNYDFAWASWDIYDWDNSYQDLGNASSCQLGIGVHNAVLTVTDRRTKIGIQIQKMIYARGERVEEEINVIA